MKKKEIPYPYPVYYWQMVLYSLVGLATSGYLMYTHYKNHTDIAFSSFCAITQAVNCDTVAQSPWSIVLALPIAVWGTFAYALFLVLLAPLRKQEKAQGWGALTLLFLAASCCSLVLAAISLSKVHSWCILCMITYVVNFLLAFTSWIIYRRFVEQPFFSTIVPAVKIFIKSKISRIGVPVILLALIVTWGGIPTYWQHQPEPISARVATGMTEQGYPWIGARDPEFTVEEYTDYQCFQCRKMHFYLRQIINRNPDRIRLVHRHYPLDSRFNRFIAPNPLHEGSGTLALLAIAAGQKGKFWQVNDAIYRQAELKNNNLTEMRDKGLPLAPFAEILQISEKELVDLMNAPETRNHLQADMLEGLQHHMLGTPSFVINGEVYEKTLPPELLREMMR